MNGGIIMRYILYFAALVLERCEVRSSAGATMRLVSGGPSFPTKGETSFPITSDWAPFPTHQRGFGRRAN
jgi:hypothetical protein